jgi:hypothetical protein
MKRRVLKQTSIRDALTESLKEKLNFMAIIAKDQPARAQIKLPRAPTANGK